MEQIKEGVLDEFKAVTKFDVRDFFIDFIGFSGEDYLNIVNFYSGRGDGPVQSSFARLEHLKEQSDKIAEIADINSGRFNTYGSWVLMEHLENISEAIMTIANLPKYLRVNTSNNQYGGGARFDYTATQGETIEAIQRRSGGTEDGWAELALENRLEEESYTTEGGFTVKVPTQYKNRFILHSVVKGIESVEDTYGLDIDRKITFQDNDLKTLGPRETIEQSGKILAGLKKGDNPFFPGHGTDLETVVGVNKNSFFYPVLLRQVAKAVATDDTFKAVELRDIRHEGDAVFIDIELQTRSGDFTVLQTVEM